MLFQKCTNFPIIQIDLTYTLKVNYSKTVAVRVTIIVRIKVKRKQMQNTFSCQKEKYKESEWKNFFVNIFVNIFFFDSWTLFPKRLKTIMVNS